MLFCNDRSLININLNISIVFIAICILDNQDESIYFQIDIPFSGASILIDT
jgi:hypothetical protein